MRLDQMPYHSMPTLAVLPFRQFSIGWTWQLRAACQRSETLLKQENPLAQQALDELDAAINRLAAQARLSA